MKDRIVFFVLGAVLATSAYFVGGLGTAKAKDKVVVENLVVKDKLILLGDAAIDGILKVNERIEVGLEANSPRIMMEVDSTSAKIVITDTAGAEIPKQHYAYIFAGRNPANMPRTAGILLKEGTQKSLVLSPE